MNPNFNPNAPYGWPVQGSSGNSQHPQGQQPAVLPESRTSATGHRGYRGPTVGGVPHIPPYPFAALQLPPGSATSHTHAGQQGHRHGGPTDNQVRQGQHNTQHPYPQALPPQLAPLAHRGALTGFSGTGHRGYSGPNSFDQVTAEQLRRLSRSPQGPRNLPQGPGTMGQNVHAQQQQQQQQGWPVPAARAAYPYPSAHSAGPSAHQFQQGSSTGGHHNVPHHVPHGGGAHPMNPASYYQPQSNLPVQYQPGMKVLEFSAKPSTEADTRLADAKELRHRFLDCEVYSVGGNNQDVRRRLCEFKTTFNSQAVSFVTSMQCDGAMPLYLHLDWPTATRQTIGDMYISGLHQRRTLTRFLRPLARGDKFLKFEASYDLSPNPRATHNWVGRANGTRLEFSWQDLNTGKELGTLSTNLNSDRRSWTLVYLPEVEQNRVVYQLGIFTSYLLILILRPFNMEEVAAEPDYRGNEDVTRSNYDFLLGPYLITRGIAHLRPY